MQPFRLLVLLPVLLRCLVGCADPNVEPVPFQLGPGHDSVVLGANLRTISERPRDVPGYGSVRTRCSEPSPDVALAFNRSLSGKVNVDQPSGPSGGGAFESQFNEAATQLDGRTAGVLALRDGLSAACQAYVNGVIGQDAYALILSQYGNLLVALAGTGTAGSAAPRFTAQETAITALLVACISKHDPTRLGSIGEAELLSVRRCERLMDNVASGRVLRPAPEKAAAPQKKVTLETPAVTVNVTGQKGAS